MLELYKEKKKYDAYTKEKEKKIERIERNFHAFVEKRIVTIAETREKRGLRTRVRESATL